MPEWQPRNGSALLKAIHEIAVDKRLGYEGQIGRLLDLGRRHFDLGVGMVTDWQGDELRVRHCRGSEELGGAVVALRDAFCGEVLLSGEPLHFHDAANGPWAEHPGHRKLGIRAYLGRPVRVKGELRGTVCLFSSEPRSGPFGDHELEEFQLLCQRVEAVLERMEVSTALERSEALYRATFERAQVGIAHVDLDGTWMRVNRRLCEILGYPEEELLQLTFQDITHPDDLGSNLSLLERSLKHEIDHYTMRKRYLRKDGEVVWADLTASLLRNADGEPEHFISVIQDVTQQVHAEESRRRFEQQMQESQRLESLGVLAGGIAHDFNNILAAILGNASLLEEALPSGSRLLEPVRAIESASQNAAELTDQMLAYAGKGAISVGEIDVPELIDEMQSLLRTVVQKNARIVWERPSERLHVRADPSQLKQVVMNLVLNASEAIEGGGTIQIRVEHSEIDPAARFHDGWHLEPAEGPHVRIAVEDSGGGMDAETKLRLFEPFYTSKFTGRGLGLSAVLGIVASHSGGIVVESEAGEGSVVGVLLPAARRDEAASGARRTPVLVVDDEATVRSVTARMLERIGLQVVAASSGENALRLLEKTGGLAGVVLDVSMPGLSMLDTIFGIRALQPEVPVVLMSGYSEQHVSQALETGAANGFLKKPFTLQQLEEQLRSSGILAEASPGEAPVSS